jgi:hypothetical protein
MIHGRIGDNTLASYSTTHCKSLKLLLLQRVAVILFRRLMSYYEMYGSSSFSHLERKPGDLADKNLTPLSDYSTSQV